MDKQFKLLERIGKGSFGQVYKAINLVSSETVAVKIIDLEEAVDDIEDIQQEIGILKQLNSPHITKYLDSFVIKSKLWLIMEFCQGGSLRDITKSNPIDEVYAAIIIRDILKGLEYLHGEGKLHRDIKGSNILLKDDGTIKICDFGVSGQLTMTMDKKNTFVGSPLWMSPEVITESGYNEKADIWSLGITAIELVKGNPPHSDIHPMKALFLIPNSEPPTLDGNFTRGFKEFVSLCLEKDAAKRPSARELLKHKFIKYAKKSCFLVNLIEQHQKLLDIKDSESDANSDIFFSMVPEDSRECWGLQDTNESFKEIEDQNTYSDDLKDWDFGTIKISSKKGQVFHNNEAISFGESAKLLNDSDPQNDCDFGTVKNRKSPLTPLSPTISLPPPPKMSPKSWGKFKIIPKESSSPEKSKHAEISDSNITISNTSILDTVILPTLNNFTDRISQRNISILRNILEEIDKDDRVVLADFIEMINLNLKAN